MLGSRSNGQLIKNVVGATDASNLVLMAAFNMCWLKVLNSRSLSSVALDASATLCLCPGTVRDTCCSCQGLGTLAHLFSDGQPVCPLAVHEPIFWQMFASLWFCYSVPLLSDAHVSAIPQEVRSAVGYQSSFVVAVKPVQDAIPLVLVQEVAAHEHFQVWCDKVKEHHSTTA